MQFRVRQATFRRFCMFSNGLLNSLDIDPVYPLLKSVYSRYELHDEVALWRTLLFLAYYHLGSAEKVWLKYPAPGLIDHDPSMVGLSAGIDRRMMRGNDKAREFINATLAHAAKSGGLRMWVDAMVGDGGERGWAHVRADFEEVLYVGPWASHKWADLLKNVHGVPIEADNAVGAEGEHAGPVPGMQLLTAESWQTCFASVDAQRGLLAYCQDSGVPFSGLDQLESALCYFSGLVGGRYYVGRNIDIQMDQLKSSGPAMWEARAALYQPRYRGEVSGWYGVRKELKRVYKDTGRIVVL